MYSALGDIKNVIGARDIFKRQKQVAPLPCQDAFYIFSIKKQKISPSS
jgi:hypothetical protein